jgi:hypothetical protein
LERRKTTSPIIHEGFLETRQGPKQWWEHETQEERDKALDALIAKRKSYFPSFKDHMIKWIESGDAEKSFWNELRKRTR